MLQMKNKKKLRGFSFPINMVNFGAFCWNKKLSSNLFCLKSGQFVSKNEEKIKTPSVRREPTAD